MASRDYTPYEKHYDDNSLKAKLKRVARTAGAKVTYAVLLLYYVSTSPSVSRADKAKIYGALGYFILPLDLIPDLLPIVGYADDLTALIWALKTVWCNITPEIKEQAYTKLTSWFGEVDRKKLKMF
jgi:uncharacterized membrane protein YkvA (DUF1232 family)